MVTVWEDDNGTERNHHAKIHFIQSVHVICDGCNYSSHVRATELHKCVYKEAICWGTYACHVQLLKHVLPNADSYLQSAPPRLRNIKHCKT